MAGLSLLVPIQRMVSICRKSFNPDLFSDPVWNRNCAVCGSEHWSKLFLIPCCTMLLMQDTAQESDGLVDVNSSGNVIMRVETTATVPDNRKSIRITTTTSYDGGALFIMDAVHMPTGCGTWP
jgi:hypothetical protein